MTEQMQKIPGIGDIPILGKLFQSRSVNKSKNELLIVVTPRLCTRYRLAKTDANLKFPRISWPDVVPRQEPVAAMPRRWHDSP